MFRSGLPWPGLWPIGRPGPLGTLSITVEWVDRRSQPRFPAATINWDRDVVHMTISLLRDSIFLTGNVSSKRVLTWAYWVSEPGVRRGVVVAVGALYVLFLMARFFFNDSCVAQKLTHFCPPGPEAYSDQIAIKPKRQKTIHSKHENQFGLTTNFSN